MTDHVISTIADALSYPLPYESHHFDRAERILAALKAARIAVVELPTWESLEDDYAVDLKAKQVRHYGPNGFGAYRVFDFAEIPSLCAALLGAKAAAEASQ